MELDNTKLNSINSSIEAKDQYKLQNSTLRQA